MSTRAAGDASPPTLSARALNRALLDRQLLLERATLSIPEAIEQIGGLQTQYAPSGYVGLWTRLAGFRRAALTEALEDRSVVQATLMRTTIHMVSGREFWRYAMGVRDARRAWSLRIPATPAGRGGEAAMVAEAARMREALAGGPKSVKELGALGAGFVGNLGLWVDLVRVPPSGTWERRRADILALAETWIGPSDASVGEGLTHLVRAYLRAFGPAAWRDIAAWAGISVEEARTGAHDLALTDYRDEAGRPLVDLRGRHPARTGDAGSGALPAALGCEPARPRPTDRHPARSLPLARLPHEEPLLRRRLPGRWRGCRCLVGAGRARRAGSVPRAEASPKRRAVEQEREGLEAFHV